jgi:hypothetical protein
MSALGFSSSNEAAASNSSVPNIGLHISICDTEITNSLDLTMPTRQDARRPI